MANSDLANQGPIQFNKEFATRKQISMEQIDKSKKGSYDQPIKDIIETVNSSKCFYTTSSCSGRIIIFTTTQTGFEFNSNNNNNSSILKSSCKWLFTSHSECDFMQVLDTIRLKLSESCVNDGIITLKFEPLILHIASASLDSGRELLQVKYKCSLLFKEIRGIIG